jgi:poly-gamma-glutamate synthesis protein (capsule biosynthesis protein)
VSAVVAAAPAAAPLPARPILEDEALPPLGHGAGEAPPFYLAVGHGAAPARLAQALERAVVADAYSVRQVSAVARADLYIGYDPPAGFHTVPLTATRFVPVVSYWLPVTEVAYADLERIFRGDVETWAELGLAVPEKVARLALQTDPPPPLAPPAGPFLPDTTALVAALEQLPGGIALVPLEQVDTRVRALRVDGHDALLEEELVPGDPLVRQLCVAYSPEAPPAAAEWALALAERQRLAPPQPAIEVVVVGDIMPGRLVGRRLLSLDDYTRPFVQVSATLSAADLTIANLEGALSDQITPPAEPQTMLFVGSGRFVEGLRCAGVDGISLANNHSRNFGGTGISHTLALLNEAGISAFGAGMDLAQARQPALFEVQGVRFAFLGYDAVSYYYAADEGRAGTAPADTTLIAADIAAAHEQADVVLTYFHWGVEYTHHPSAQQEDLAHQAVEAGADIVLGNHPHWVQGLERYQGVPIIYSIGNFVFDQRLSLETRQGVIAHLVFRGPRLVQLRLQAIQIEEYYKPVLLPPAAAQEVYRQMQEVSPEWTREKGATP